MALAKENLLAIEKRDGSEKASGLVKSIGMMSNTSTPSSANSSGYAFQYSEDQDQIYNSLIQFKSGYGHFMHANASTNLLSFEQNENKDDHGYSMWEGNLNHQMINQKYSNSDPRLVEDFNCFDTASNYGFLINNPARENPGDWLFTEATAVTDTILESGSSLKRPNSGESTQVVKKQCSSAATKKANKQKTSAPISKDPQSIAAKNRRERISERLKILQELVPNGSKVDLVTMLEKAISYVKFLQLQVKVLATDEFWPVQGGKAPDISQVREAIDAILSSQRDRISISK